MVLSRVKIFLSERLIRDAGLFDAVWYRAAYSDICETASDPLRHYICHGAAERRDPSPLFDTRYYLAQYPDLDPETVNPLCHYIIVGEREGAWPNPYFDPSAVRPFVNQQAARRSSVLSSYVKLGPTHISPSMRLDSGVLLAQNPLIGAAGISPLSYSLGSAQQAEPSALFSSVPTVARFASMSGLQPLVTECGYVFFQVSDNDPHLVMLPEGADSFEAGHYRISIAYKGHKEALLRAKIYLDYGAGFNERDTVRPGFAVSESGMAEGLIGLNCGVKAIRFDPIDSQLDGQIVYGIGSIALSKISTLGFYCKVVSDIATSPVHAVKLVGKTALMAMRRSPSEAAKALCMERDQRRNDLEAPRAQNVLYLDWVKRFDTITDEDVIAMQAAFEIMPDKPLISVVMPVYNTPESLLRACIDSVLAQTYPNWELCIADDKSSDPNIRDILLEYEQRDSRVRFVIRTENGHISEASNSALAIAKGKWVALLDHDDLLPPHALFCVADAINRNPDAKIFYSDEDKIDLNGERSNPHFKTDWNERLFFEQNMVSHLGVFETDLVREVGGFRKGYEGSQDHDLVLRLVEKVEPDQIVHIPHILYHWRIVPGSTALGTDEKSYVLSAGVKALEDAIDRRSLKARVDARPDLGYYKLRLEPPAKEPMVSIVIPTRDGMDVLEPCVRSVLEKTTYSNFEILIVDNQSEKEETLAYFKALEKTPNVRVLPYDDVFNYSAINNYAVSLSKGELVCLLNNDTEVISPEWLSQMVAELSRETVGAVGAKLLYTDGTVQHAGVVLGVGGDMGVAGHGLLSLGGEAGGYFSYALLAREVSAVTAACLLTTREVFDEVGGLNEGALRVAFNDVDFCLKIREAGYKIIWTPHAVLHHHESKSRGLEDTPEKQARFSREVHYMLDRWGELLQHDPYYNPNLSLNAETYSLADQPRVDKPWRL